mmetsp:Transcript_1977/g.3123  ORF Transcript_1977/g.3123 Transcript_1977/m.3123 type:complete len:622 (-) Transcript_1977:126-1991(-)
MASKRMESPLVPVILYKIGSMRRHYQPSDEHDVAQNDERLQQRRPQAPSDSSRVRQADPPAGASPASIAPTMHAAKKRRTSDASSAQSYPFQKSKSFEERNEERSAFVSLPKTIDEKDTATASNQEEEEKKRPSQDPEEAGGPIMPQPVASMPMSSTIPTASAASSAQPHLSPMRYYHQQRYAESIRAKPDAPTFPYQYRGGAAHPTQPDPYGYGYPAGYYHPPQYPRPDPRPDPPSARGHPQFPYFQGYSYQHPHQNPNNMMPSAAAAAAYSQQHRPFVDEYYRAPGSTPPRTYAKKDPPESAKVTEEAKGGGGGGGEFDLSPTLPSPPVEEDERKPSARRSSSSIQESSSRDHVNDELHDLYAPLPFNEVRSLLTSSMKTPSPPSPSIQFAKSAASHLDPFSTTPERTHARGAQLPQPSPVVSTAKKRRRGRHPEHAAIGQSYSAGSTASVASTSTSRRENITDSASRRGNSWDRRYNELLEFKQLHGHCDVPQNYAPNPSLGIWVNKQRMEHKNRFDGKSSALNDGRLARLQSIGFRWAKRKGQASWEEKFKELKEYKAEYGNCHVPTKYKENTALGRWVSTQRSEYKKFCEGDTKSAMNADKIRRLESIGFAWFMVL